MPAKITCIEIIVDNVTSPVSVIQSVRKFEDYAIQVNYGAGGVGDMELEASIDGINFGTIAGSAQAMDIAGGTHVWNVTDAHYVSVRIVIPGTAVNTTVLFAGNGNWD